MQSRPDQYEQVIPHSSRLQVAHDTLSLRELIEIVKAGVAWWEQRLQSAEGVNREHAAAAIRELSLILASLAEQLAQGRETVRITRRLPNTRHYTLGCPVCGHGNRSGARFCKTCGSALPAAEQPRSATTTLHHAPLRVETATCSDKGCVRERNEDTCYAGTIAAAGSTITLLLVADGMGGVSGGEYASRLASETVQHEMATILRGHLPADDAAWHTLLRRVVQRANRVIYDTAHASNHYQGMGTTLTLAAIASTRAHIAHVGDSRLLLINAQGVTDDGAPVMPLTSDHSLVARLVDIGQLTPAEARKHPHRNVLYRALGVDPTVEIDVGSQPLNADDRLLCCSDGLTNLVEDTEVAHLVLSTPTLHDACSLLVALANERGGHDNSSVVLGQVVRNW